MIEKLKKRIEALPAFKAILESPNPHPIVTGVSGSLVSIIIGSLFTSNQGQILVIASDLPEAERLRDDLQQVLGEERVHTFFGKPTDHVSQPHHTGLADIQALLSLSKKSVSVIVATATAMLCPLPRSQEVLAHALSLNRGDKINLSAIVKRLLEAGFEQKELVATQGEIAVRGGLLDIFSYGSHAPIRVELSGDDIESIREFDATSQRSSQLLSGALIIPDILGLAAAEDSVRHDWSLLDYVQLSALVALHEPELINRILEEAIEGDSTSIAAKGKLDEMLELFRTVSLSAAANPSPECIDFGSRSQPSYNSSISVLRRDLAGLIDLGNEIFFTCDSHAELVRLKDLLGASTPSNEVEAHDAPHVLDLQSIDFSLEALHAGFQIPDAHIMVFTEHQVFNRNKRRGRSRIARFKGFTDRELHQLRKGDYVVHQDFGIGRYDGMRRIKVGSAEQEVVRVQYAERDILFVNLNHIGKLQKYSSREGHVPALTRIGGGEWERLKARVKRKAKDIARELIALYARRKAASGFAFSADTSWQRELEASFMYEETFDQAKATRDVKADMEAPHPMDRLICGDVGFGKTEVAVRAAFKAVLDKKQVVLLVPTTILAMQHFNTFNDRLGRYGVRIGVLSRLRTQKEQKSIQAMLKTGEIDIAIGTHRLLSKDITFSNPGLLVIDEEHRFGVAAKEKLRKMRAEIDTLSMTATPIPRTLHFSLMGARDLSIISTPPRNRMAVITEILQWDDDIIRDAIMRELQRGGQAYFVHDRVQTMGDVATRLQRLMPAVKFRSAHGQMAAHELEGVMVAFLERKCDVLIATKIIESGLDLPNVNTIIINRADKFGMAELYQLRGRVGRSNIQAYAYLVTPPIASIPTSTLRRLQALEEFTDLGSGFNLAMRDLEIRGAGNLLGSEQSGFIESMGFETYTRVLDEAVQELKVEEFQGMFDQVGDGHGADREVLIDADVNALIPEAYLPSDTERLAIYRRLYAISSTDQLDELREELTDRFGRFPPEVENLLQIVRVRLFARRIGFTRIKLSSNRMEAELPPESDPAFYESHQFERLMTFLSNVKDGRAKLEKDGPSLVLVVRLDMIEGNESDVSKALALMSQLVAAG